MKDKQRKGLKQKLFYFSMQTWFINLINLTNKSWGIRLTPIHKTAPREPKLIGPLTTNGSHAAFAIMPDIIDKMRRTKPHWQYPPSLPVFLMNLLGPLSKSRDIPKLAEITDVVKERKKSASFSAACSYSSFPGQPPATGLLVVNITTNRIHVKWVCGIDSTKHSAKNTGINTIEKCVPKIILLERSKSAFHLMLQSSGYYINN